MASNVLTLFREGDVFFAFNQDAERIFETKGWFLSEIKTPSSTYSLMEISHEGLKVLERDFHKIDLLSLADTEMPLQKGTQQNNERRAMASIQQSLECLELQVNGEKAIITTPNLTYFALVDNLYEVEHQINSILLSKGNVQVVENNGERHTLMEDGSWLMGKQQDISFSLLDKFDNYLRQNGDILKERVKEYKSNTIDRLDMVNSILAEYSNSKSNLADIILLHKGNEDYFAYGNDAIKIANNLKVPLWQIERGPGRPVPVTILSTKGNGIDILSHEGLKSEIVTPKTAYDRYSLPFELSPLNVGLQSKAEFENASVFKMRNGEYAIRASLSGNELENKIISAKVASQFLALPYGEEKDATLKTILVTTYKPESSKGEYIGWDFSKNI